MTGNPIARERAGLAIKRQVVPRIGAHEWSQMTDVQKISAVMGINLDEMLYLVSIPYEDALPYERHLKARLFEAQLRLGMTLVREHGLQEREDRLIGELTKVFERGNKA